MSNVPSKSEWDEVIGFGDIDLQLRLLYRLKDDISSLKSVSELIRSHQATVLCTAAIEALEALLPETEFFDHISSLLPYFENPLLLVPIVFKASTRSMTFTTLLQLVEFSPDTLSPVLDLIASQPDPPKKFVTKLLHLKGAEYTFFKLYDVFDLSFWVETIGDVRDLRFQALALVALCNQACNTMSHVEDMLALSISVLVKSHMRKLYFPELLDTTLQMLGVIDVTPEWVLGAIAWILVDCSEQYAESLLDLYHFICQRETLASVTWSMVQLSLVRFISSSRVSLSAKSACLLNTMKRDSRRGVFSKVPTNYPILVTIVVYMQGFHGSDGRFAISTNSPSLDKLSYASSCINSQTHVFDDKLLQSRSLVYKLYLLTTPPYTDKHLSLLKDIHLCIGQPVDWRYTTVAVLPAVLHILFPLLERQVIGPVVFQQLWTIYWSSPIAHRHPLWVLLYNRIIAYISSTGFDCDVDRRAACMHSLFLLCTKLPESGLEYIGHVQNALDDPSFLIKALALDCVSELVVADCLDFLTTFQVLESRALLPEIASSPKYQMAYVSFLGQYTVEWDLLDFSEMELVQSLTLRLWRAFTCKDFSSVSRVNALTHFNRYLNSATLYSFSRASIPDPLPFPIVFATHPESFAELQLCLASEASAGVCSGIGNMFALLMLIERLMRNCRTTGARESPVSRSALNLSAQFLDCTRPSLKSSLGVNLLQEYRPQHGEFSFVFAELLKNVTLRPLKNYAIFFTVFVDAWGHFLESVFEFYGREIAIEKLEDVLSTIDHTITVEENTILVRALMATIISKRYNEVDLLKSRWSTSFQACSTVTSCAMHFMCLGILTVNLYRFDAMSLSKSLSLLLTSLEFKSNPDSVCYASLGLVLIVQGLETDNRRLRNVLNQLVSIVVENDTDIFGSAYSIAHLKSNQIKDYLILALVQCLPYLVNESALQNLLSIGSAYENRHVGDVLKCKSFVLLQKLGISTCPHITLCCILCKALVDLDSDPSKLLSEILKSSQSSSTHEAELGLLALSVFSGTPVFGPRILNAGTELFLIQPTLSVLTRSADTRVSSLSSWVHISSSTISSNDPIGSSSKTKVAVQLLKGLDNKPTIPVLYSSLVGFTSLYNLDHILFNVTRKHHNLTNVNACTLSNVFFERNPTFHPNVRMAALKLAVASLNSNQLSPLQHGEYDSLVSILVGVLDIPTFKKYSREMKLLILQEIPHFIRFIPLHSVKQTLGKLLKACQEDTVNLKLQFVEILPLLQEQLQKSSPTFSLSSAEASACEIAVNLLSDLEPFHRESFLSIESIADTVYKVVNLFPRTLQMLLPLWDISLAMACNAALVRLTLFNMLPYNGASLIETTKFISETPMPVEISTLLINRLGKVTREWSNSRIEDILLELLKNVSNNESFESWFYMMGSVLLCWASTTPTSDSMDLHCIASALPYLLAEFSRSSSAQFVDTVIQLLIGLEVRFPKQRLAKVACSALMS